MREAAAMENEDEDDDEEEDDEVEYEDPEAGIPPHDKYQTDNYEEREWPYPNYEEGADPELHFFGHTETLRDKYDDEDIDALMKLL